MKTKALQLVSLLFILSATPLLAGGITLRWDASPSTGVTGYLVYASAGTNALAPMVRVGTNTAIRLDFLTNGVWKFAVSAERQGIESDLSNTLTIDVPQSPANLRVLAVQASGTLVGDSWTNVGFFRLEIVR